MDVLAAGRRDLNFCDAEPSERDIHIFMGDHFLTTRHNRASFCIYVVCLHEVVARVLEF